MKVQNEKGLWFDGDVMAGGFGTALRDCARDITPGHAGHIIYKLDSYFKGAGRITPVGRFEEVEAAYCEARTALELNW